MVLLSDCILDEPLIVLILVSVIKQSISGENNVTQLTNYPDTDRVRETDI